MIVHRASLFCDSTVELRGGVGGRAARVVEQRIEQLLAQGQRRIGVDLREVTELDVEGARILRRISERLRSAQGSLVLITR